MTLRSALRASIAVAVGVLCSAAAPDLALPSVRGLAGVSAQVTTTIESGFEVELRKLESGSFVSAAEVAQVLSIERQQQLLGGEANPRITGLNATDVVWVEVAARGPKFLITARRVSREGRVLNTSELEVGPDAGELAGAATRMVPKLFPELKQRAEPSVPARGARPIRVAVLEVRTTGDVPRRAFAALEQSITPELRKIEGVSAVASSELRDMLGVERQKQLLGCGEDASACLQELAGALDADEMVTFDLTLVGGTYALTARRTDLRQAKVVQTQLKQFAKRDGEEVLAVIGPTIAALYPDRPLKTGRVRGVEAEVIRRLNPPPLPRWVFLATSGVALAAGVAGSTFGWVSFDAQRDFGAAAQRSLLTPVSAADLTALRAKSNANAATANTFFAVAGGLALAAVVEIFFTDWREDRAAFSAQPMVFPGGGGVVVGWAR